MSSVSSMGAVTGVEIYIGSRGNKNKYDKARGDGSVFVRVRFFVYFG